MRRIDLPGGTLNTYREGAGEPLLFVHGFPLDHAMWIEQLSVFAWSHDVIAPDLPGFGQSPPRDEVSTMEGFAEVCAQLLDALGIDRPVTLVGLSMGGYVAFQFARRFAGRLGRLVLCDTRSAADTEPARATRLQMAEHVLEYGTSAVADLMPGKMFAPATLRDQPAIVERVRQTIRTTSPQGVAAAQRGMAARPDVSAWLPEINLPALVAVGAEDAISPVDEMRAIASAIPGATFEVIARAGHLAPLEQPAAFNRVLRAFLAS